MLFWLQREVGPPALLAMPMEPMSDAYEDMVMIDHVLMHEIPGMGMRKEPSEGDEHGTDCFISCDDGWLHLQVG